MMKRRWWAGAAAALLATAFLGAAGAQAPNWPGGKYTYTAPTPPAKIPPATTNLLAEEVEAMQNSLWPPSAIVRSDVSCTQNYVLAAPAGANGNLACRGLVLGDLPDDATAGRLLAAGGAGGAPSYVDCTVIGSEFACPAASGTGGSVVMSEPSSIGTDSVAWKVKNTGVSTPRVHEFTDAGWVPAAVIEGLPGGAGKQACFNGATGLLEASATACGAGGGGGGGPPSGATAPLTCTSTPNNRNGFQYYDTDAATTCSCQIGSNVWCRNDTGACGSATDCFAGSQPAANMTSQLVALWRMEEDGTAVRINAEGTAARDLTPTAGGIARTTAGVADGTYALNCPAGNTGAIRLESTSTSLTQLAPPFTLFCWLKPEDSDPALPDTATPSIFGTSVWGGNSFNGAWFDYVEGQQKVRWNLSNGAVGGQTSIVGGGANYTPLTTLHQVVGTVNGAETRGTLYVDGVQNSQQTGLTNAYTPPGGGFRACMAGAQAGRTYAGTLDTCGVDDMEWSAESANWIARCGPEGLLCECDGTNAPGNYYKACATSADCRTRVNTGQLCDAATSTCRGRNAGTTPPVVSGTPLACNVTALVAAP
jgi:hypothetical protein